MTTYTSLTDKIARKQAHYDTEKGRKIVMKIRPISDHEGRLAFQNNPSHIDEDLLPGDKLVIHTQYGYEELFYGKGG